MSITQVSATVLGVITGANSLCPVPAIYENLMNANSFMINQTQSFGTVIWTLSGDSQTITLSSAALGSACDDRAVKNSAKSYTNRFQLMSILTMGSVFIRLMHF
jgi:hypothetical protein